MGILYGPDVSICIRSKAFLVLILLEEKGNLDCLERGQTLHEESQLNNEEGLEITIFIAKYGNAPNLGAITLHQRYYFA